MPTLKELRLEARLSVNALAKLAHVDRATIDRAERGDPVYDYSAAAIVQTLAKQLGRTIRLEDVDGLRII
jgi:predicted transcriptional regulator